eukprot:scaffold149_cov383-Prasinococcus_capsulatus_cf.AAC.29
MTSPVAVSFSYAAPVGRITHVRSCCRLRSRGNEGHRSAGGPSVSAGLRPSPSRGVHGRGHSSRRTTVVASGSGFNEQVMKPLPAKVRRGRQRDCVLGLELWLKDVLRVAGKSNR